MKERFDKVSGQEFTFEIGFEITFNGGKHDFIENESRLFLAFQSSLAGLKSLRKPIKQYWPMSAAHSNQLKSIECVFVLR